MTTDTREATSVAAFSVWQQMRDAEFDLLMAYKYEARDCLHQARAKLLKAVEVIDALENLQVVSGGLK